VRKVSDLVISSPKCGGGICRIYTRAGFAAASLSGARDTHKRNPPATLV